MAQGWGSPAMPPVVSWVRNGAYCGMQQGIEQWHRDDIDYALAEMMAGSTGVVQVLQQPVVIAATGSLLWLALLALLLLICQRRASQDSMAQHG